MKEGRRRRGRKEEEEEEEEEEDGDKSVKGLKKEGRKEGRGR